MKLIDKYKSPNFNKRKKGTFLNYIILHYTAMKNYKEALYHLCDKKNKVSSHFLINKSGDIFYLVSITSRAWHAGKSNWHKISDINSESIGIEIDNSGHYYEFENYKELTNKVGIKIIPSGNWLLDLQIFNQAIKNRIWTATRTDMAMMGGITFAKEAITLSEAAGMDCEIMSWGYTLPSVANLHLMLSTNKCTYYEQPLPYETFEFGMNDVLRTKDDGFMHAPTKPGLGVEINWDLMKTKIIPWDIFGWNCIIIGVF